MAVSKFTPAEYINPQREVNQIVGALIKLLGKGTAVNISQEVLEEMDLYEITVQRDNASGDILLVLRRK